jgi:hypothetical protein
MGTPAPNANRLASVQARLEAHGLIFRFLRRYCAQRVLRLEDVLDCNRRSRRLVHARRELWSVCLWSLGWSSTEIASLFGVDHCTILYAAKLREKELAALYEDAGADDTLVRAKTLPLACFNHREPAREVQSRARLWPPFPDERTETQ